MGISQLENKSGWLVSGGILASLAASICCVGPLILTVLGVSGAAALSKFEKIRLPMILIVVLFFATAGLALYRKRNSCEPGSLCADPRKFKKMVIFYWLGVAIAALGITSPQWIAFLFS